MKIREFVLFACFLLTLGALSAQSAITLKSTMYVQDSSATDVWGYYDAATNREYALVGSWNAVSIIDVTDPFAPFYVAFMDSVDGFDIKVWDHYFYCVSGNGSGFADVVDIADPTNPVVVGQFPNAHNIWITDGYLGAAFPGLKIYDLNQDPTQPDLKWQDSLSQGHDVLMLDNLMYYFEGSGFWIYDFSNPQSPVLLAQRGDPGFVYVHSGWPTGDGKHLIVADELIRGNNPDLTMWDISNLNNIFKVDQFTDTSSIVHNPYIIGNYAFVSYYKAGFRIFDVHDPTNFQLLATYDTYPDADDENFGGDFGLYPFAPSGNIYASDMTYGLFVFGVDTTVTAAPGPKAIQPLKLQLSPNPSTGLQQLVVELKESGPVHIRAVDLQGKEIRNWHWKSLPKGQHQCSIDLTGLPAGLYTLQIRAGSQSAAIKSQILD